MLESLALLLSSLLDAKSKITKSSKKKLGKELARLYVGLVQIIENGEEILQILRKAQQKRKINISALLTLLFAQAEKIRSIQAIIKKSKIETILKVHLPKLKDLQILLEMKGDRIAVLSDQRKIQELKGFLQTTLTDPKAYRMRWWSELKLVPPTEEPLKKSHHDLNEIKRLADIFRKFLVEKFNIDEII